MHALHHAAVQVDRALAGILRQLESRDHVAGSGNFRLVRRENPVRRRDLPGVDQRLAVHPEIPALQAFCLKPFLVAKIVIDPVHDRKPVRAGRGNADRQPGQHSRPAVFQSRTGLLGKVVGPHDECGQPSAPIIRRCRDLTRFQHPQRRFHHRPQLDGGIGMTHVACDREHVRSLRNLRYQDGVRLRLDGGGKVVVPPRRIEPVDADNHFSVTIAAGGNGIAYLLARQLFHVGRDGILKVQNE